MVFHWSRKDRKAPRVSRTLLSILAVLNNAVIWISSVRPDTFPDFFGLFQVHQLQLVSLSPLDSTALLAFWQDKSVCQFFCLCLFILYVTLKWQILFFYLINTWCGLWAGIWWSVCIKFVFIEWPSYIYIYIYI